MARNAKSPSGATRAKNQTEKKPGRLRQMIEVYKYTQQTDSSTLPLMILGFVVAMAIAVALSWWILNSPWYGLFLGLGLGLLAAMFILARKAERAAFARIAGQPGAVLAAMQSIRRGWNVTEEPVQVDRRSQKMLFRASGRAGIALVAEDSTRPSMQMLDKETKAVQRVLNHAEVPIHRIIVGDGDGEVPLHKLPSHMTRMKPQLTKQEAAEVSRRLAALQRSFRQQVPQGVDPFKMRPDRRALKGR